jgi:hypothetical protein
LPNFSSWEFFDLESNFSWIFSFFIRFNFYIKGISRKYSCVFW